MARVLVVEDDDFAAMVVGALLKKQGVTHELAASGEDCITRWNETAATEPFDVVRAATQTERPSDRRSACSSLPTAATPSMRRLLVLHADECSSMPADAGAARLGARRHDGLGGAETHKKAEP